MLEQFLYEQLEIAFKYGVPKPQMPDSITQNLNPAFELRPYQEDAYMSFIHCFEKGVPGEEKPLHFLFNMATGSGKTLIMAGLMLYLYEKGSATSSFSSTTNIRKDEGQLAGDKIRFLVKTSALMENLHCEQSNNFEGVNENDINI